MRIPRPLRPVLVLLLAAALAGGGWAAWRLARARRAPPGWTAGGGEGMLRERLGEESVTTEVNAKAPGLASVSLQGAPVRSIDFIGDKVLLLEFWSVFCTSCIQEMPFLAELHRKYSDQGLEVVGVNTDFFPAERIRKFMARLEPRPSYPIIHDRNQEISRAYHVEALPVTVLVDSSGWIRMYHLGYKPEDRATLEAAVRKWTGRIHESRETVGAVAGRTQVGAPGALLKAGAPLPEAEALSADGVRHTLSGYRGGRPMAIFFWSLFCQPCREEMPLLVEESVVNPEVAFLSVNVDTGRLAPAVSRFLDQQRLPFPTLLDAEADPPGSLSSRLGVSYTPTLILAGADGSVRRVAVGSLVPEELKAALRGLAGPAD